MRKPLVIFVIFSLLLSIPAFPQYKGKSFSEIKAIMNVALKLVGVKAEILKIVVNQTLRVDFYARMTTGHFPDQHSFEMMMAGVVAVVGDCTRQTSWTSDKLYFCHVNTHKPTHWIYTKDCRSILRQAESGVSSSRLSRAILKALHTVERR